MKKLSLMMVTVMMLTGFIFIDFAEAGRVGKRQVRQQKRIHHGVANGELTKGEAVRLEKQQIHIQRAKKRAWSDGKLTPKERIRLEKKQDRASRNIYRKKHNDLDRE